MSTPIPIHQRRYETEAFDEGDGTMRVVGRLVDTKPHGLALADGEPLVIHDMTIEMVLAPEGFVIQSINAEMHVHPYGECPGVLASYQQLVGTSIARGYSRRVKELFGGPNGCSHIGALLIALGPVVIQASWGLSRINADPTEFGQPDPDPVETARHMQLNENTCHIWKSDGAQMTRLRSGERTVRPQWETDRLVKLGVIAENDA